VKECPNGCGLPLRNADDTQHNCVAELRTSLELLRSEMICKLQDQQQELELRLDAQRRHMVQKQASLVALVENLKSQMVCVLQDVQTLKDTGKRHEEELERAAMEKRELVNILATIQSEPRSSGVSPRKFYCRQSSRNDRTGES
jgi:E3 ubiquitin-protein ligase NRDP1